MKRKPPHGLGRHVPYLYAVVGGLLLAHWITVFLTLNNPDAAAAAWAPWFDMDREYNVPTLANTIFLGLSAIVSLGLAWKAKPYLQRTGWLAFAMLFGYLAADELLIIHEQLAEPIRELLNISGSNPLYHAWVIPASVIILLMGATVWGIRRYYKQLKVFSDTLALVAVLAAVVVCIEIVGTYIYPNTAAYRLFMIPLEEGFELTMAVTILRKQLAHWYA